jgi:isocitrate/isopropylmalate dehydrogenase
MFEPVHGSAPNIAGKDLANPVGAVLTGAMMLYYLGFSREAARIEKAVKQAIRQKQVTPDLGGKLGTKEAAQQIIALLETA